MGQVAGNTSDSVKTCMFKMNEILVSFPFTVPESRTGVRVSLYNCVGTYCHGGFGVKFLIHQQQLCEKSEHNVDVWAFVLFP